MTPHDLFLEAARCGLQLGTVKGALSVRPKGKCPDDLMTLLREHKVAFVEWLDSPPCPGWQAVPPCDLPLDPAKPEPTPEQRARLMDYLLRQGAGSPGALAAWLDCRKTAYAAGPGRDWEAALVAYVVARDAVCWQLNRNVEEVCELLAGCEEAAGGE